MTLHWRRASSLTACRTVHISPIIMATGLRQFSLCKVSPFLVNSPVPVVFPELSMAMRYRCTLLSSPSSTLSVTVRQVHQLFVGRMAISQRAVSPLPQRLSMMALPFPRDPSSNMCKLRICSSEIYSTDLLLLPLFPHSPKIKKFKYWEIIA